MSRFFCFFFPLIVLLSGCSSGNTAIKLTQSITALTTEDSVDIVWLDTYQTSPVSMTVLTQGTEGRFSTIYRWQGDIVREIERQGEVLINGKLHEQHFLIRYDSDGQAVYQKNRLDGAIRSIRVVELHRLQQQAEKKYRDAKQLLTNNKLFFQGYWQEGVFEGCQLTGANRLELQHVLSKPALNRLRMEDNFIAAVGTVKRNTYTVEHLIALESGSSECFERPEF